MVGFVGNEPEDSLQISKLTHTMNQAANSRMDLGGPGMQVCNIMTFREGPKATGVSDQTIVEDPKQSTSFS